MSPKLILLCLFGIACAIKGDERRVRRGFRSHYKNYLDEMAMSICAAVSTQPGYVFAVRRQCGEKANCQTICISDEFTKQTSSGGKMNCAESLHVYKSTPTLADNYDKDTDVHKRGLQVYRYHSCALAGCGPNYCCCIKN